ncbi:hypothetical protein CH296_28265 [Rhodococcus sp. 14-2496-1d]|uniref:hypothetical protein n=1 Tax=Rhodococcus sp. 14-2496-1d TaxID=2023146 RepID=UPI000B9B7106|nr:hypothetical protein [Rhodococcus sp. 14-2496-1d]OZF24608.1 hypothetical protein CH296_28265 [Rhodococcus sp. 14-2496-1d]
MGEKIRVTTTFDVEVTDEMTLRSAGFKARQANPALSLSWDDTLDSNAEALKLLLGHVAISSIPGARPLAVSTTSVPITDEL